MVKVLLRKLLLDRIDPTWSASIVDFNGDNSSDIFWRNNQTGENAVWIVENSTVTTAAFLETTDISWSFSIVDFNGDGKSDIFWRNPNCW